MTEKKLRDAFCDITDPEVMEGFFAEIFTPHEIKDLNLRWESIKLIKQKLPQREISKKLGISLCKITRASKIVKDSESVSNKLLEEN